MNRACKILLVLALLASLASCATLPSARTSGHARATNATQQDTREPRADETTRAEPFTGRLIHVFVALCDNVNQGIVPVSASLGNGEDPQRNLYWGAAFGIKTYFNKSRNWKLVAATKNPRAAVLERLVFRHRTLDAYLVADAYRGAEIAQATYDFLGEASGNSRDTFTDGTKTYSLTAASHLVAYVGHNGLMDFRLNKHPTRADEQKRDAVILACASKSYFDAPLRDAGAHPLLWTTNLMAPEAYVLDAAVEGWLRGEQGEQVRERAAQSYHAYQKCGINAARRLFASGW